MVAPLRKILGQHPCARALVRCYCLVMRGSGSPERGRNDRDHDRQGFAAEIVDRMSGGSIPTEATMRTAYAALCKSKAAWAISKADKEKPRPPVRRRAVTTEMAGRTDSVRNA